MGPEELYEEWRGAHIGSHLITKDYVAAPDVLEALRSWTREAYLAGYEADVEGPAEGEPEPPVTKSWQAEAIQTIRVQGIPVNPGSLELKKLLDAPGWGGSRSLSDGMLNDALQVAINRAKGGGNPVGLLTSILERETAKDILEGHEAKIPGVTPKSASNTTTGEGRHAWEPDQETKLKALLGHASTCRERAAKSGCPEDLVGELEAEARRYEAEAARIGGAER